MYSYSTYLVSHTCYLFSTLPLSPWAFTFECLLSVKTVLLDIFLSHLMFNIGAIKNVPLQLMLSLSCLWIFQSASGTGLAFIVFTEAVVQMPGSQAWSMLFFIMLFALGLSSMFGNVESILTPLLDCPSVAKSIPKEAVSGKDILSNIPPFLTISSCCEIVKSATF